MGAVLMYAAMEIPAGARVGLCPDGGHLATMGPVVAVQSGRLDVHPTHPVLRDVCPGSKRLARHVGHLPGYLIQESTPDRQPGGRYVIWTSARRLPEAIFDHRQDAEDFGFTPAKVDTAQRCGQSAQHGDGWWKARLVEVAAWGWIERHNLVVFADLLLRDSVDAAKAMLLQPDGQIHRPLLGLVSRG